MKSSPLTRISVATSPEAEEAVAELVLHLFGQTPSTYFDAETGATTVSTYLEKPSQWNLAAKRRLQAGLHTIRECGLALGSGKISMSKVRREDWAESWKRHFKPLVISTALLIKPSWVRRPARRGQAVVILDPGLSFGTGHHATTSFCLRQLVAARSGAGLGSRAGTASPQSPPARNPDPNPAPPLSFLDIGTGSGILAIAAAKLGYAPVCCFDFDPESVRVAKANAAQNEVARR